MIRRIIQIDEDKCDGCGLCASACEEGAIRIIDGKARLISDSYCDGLGACIGECPNDAINIIEREAEEFDEREAERRITGHTEQDARQDFSRTSAEEALPCGCPGSMAQELYIDEAPPQTEMDEGPEHVPSRLRNWPVQLRLVPVNAPYLREADVLLAADCVPFALSSFHRRLLDGKILLIGCPKLDDAAWYHDKLVQILKENDIQSLAVAYMEVPCCFGLVNLARQAVRESGKNIPFSTIKVGIHGDIKEEEGIRV